MKPSNTRRAVLRAALLLGIVVVVYVGARPMTKLVLLKARMPTLEIPPGTDRYDAKLRRVFKEAYAPDVTLRCLVTGGMLECVVFVRDKHAICLQTFPSTSVWDHEYREMILTGEITQTGGNGSPISAQEIVAKYGEVPVGLDDYPLRRDSMPISDDLLLELHAVWLDALNHARKDQEHRIGLDGATNSYFLRIDKGRELAGSIWSPNSGPAAALNEVSTALGVTARSESGLKHLREAIRAYWQEAEKRTPNSLELDYNNSPLSRRPSR